MTLYRILKEVDLHDMHKNGTIHTAVDPQPFTGDILIGGGKILKIASHIDDDYEQLIEAAGLNIYPGLLRHTATQVLTVTEWCARTGYQRME